MLSVVRGPQRNPQLPQYQLPCGPLSLKIVSSSASSWLCLAASFTSGRGDGWWRLKEIDSETYHGAGYKKKKIRAAAAGATGELLSLSHRRCSENAPVCLFSNLIPTFFSSRYYQSYQYSTRYHHSPIPLALLLISISLLPPSSPSCFVPLLSGGAWFDPD